MSKSVFFRLLKEEDKGIGLSDAVAALRRGQEESAVRVADPNSFGQIPGSPFAYWTPQPLINAFEQMSCFENETRTVRQGGVTGDDARYIRAFWEVSSVNLHTGQVAWVPFAKGGATAPFWRDLALVVHWDFGRCTFFGFTGLLHRPSEKPSSADLYFRGGLTWPLRASRFAPIPLPKGSAFSIRGYAILAPADDLSSLLAMGNSSIFDYVFKLALGRFAFPEFVVGVLQKLPFPQATERERLTLSELGLRSIETRRAGGTVHETSHAFTILAALQTPGDSLTARFAEWQMRVGDAERQVAGNQRQIDDIAFKLYGISDEDRRAIEESLGGASGEEEIEGADEDGEEEGQAPADPRGLAADLVSYALGCVFGRWDIRMALDSSLIPDLQDPFDPLPVCPPGMLVGTDGLPATVHNIASSDWLRARANVLDRPDESRFRLPRARAQAEMYQAKPGVGQSEHEYYPMLVAWDGILVDDRDSKDDIILRVREAFQVIWQNRADAIEREACDILGVKTLRDYFRKPTGFFADHLKRYSKSRRQAPIYWPLSTASGSYTLWLYYHRLTSDTLFNAVNNCVNPKVADAERRIQNAEARLETAAGAAGTKVRDEVDELKAFRDELLDLKKKLLRVAELPYYPDLNDGVIINAAPLHKLFRLPKWAKACEECWKKLEKGEYDWAHMALEIWPDRVREVCKKDRSIAIAHGLEHLCEAPPPKASKRRVRQDSEPEDIEEEEQ